MKKFRLLKWLAPGVLAAALMLTPAAAFTDTEAHWASGAIEKWSREYSIIQGYAGTIFKQPYQHPAIRCTLTLQMILFHSTIPVNDTKIRICYTFLHSTIQHFLLMGILQKLHPGIIAVAFRKQLVHESYQ